MSTWCLQSTKRKCKSIFYLRMEDVSASQHITKGQELLDDLKL